MTLVLLHGFTGSPRSFAHLELSARAPDLPGHGAAADATSWEDALDRIGKEQPSALLGYSMGARLALGFALRRPARLERLILLSGTGGIEDPAERARRKSEDEALADFIEQRGVPDFVRRWEEHPSLVFLRPFAERLRAERLSHRAEGLASALRHLGAGAQPSYWSELRALELPVTLVAGADDEKFAALARRMHALLPRSTLHVLERCGHAPHLERPKALLEAIR